MARKTIVDLDPRLHSALEEFKALSVIKGEAARDAYDYQDAETRAMIDRILATLRASATGYINVKVGNSLYPLKIDDQTFGFNLMWLAVEIVKDLAFVGLQVANFQFNPRFCASCGEEL